MSTFIEKAKAVMIGHAIGDALGVPVEFRSREYLKLNPVTDMLGYGTYPMPKGSWSDDTSMSLCAMESLSRGKIDFDDIMRNFCKWYYYGEFTPTGTMFDVGNTCGEAIQRYKQKTHTYNSCGLAHEFSNGNGSLMRIHPLALYTAKNIYSDIEKLDFIHKASSLTHAHKRSQIACGIYAFVFWELLNQPCKNSVKIGFEKAKETYKSYDFQNNFFKEFAHGKFDKLLNQIEELTENEIKSDGYVVHTLEAAIWCLMTTNSYKKCVLKAVNLGGDTDTTAAVAGGLAGALYGYDAIPQEWKNTLLKREYIEELCEKTFN